MNIAGVDPGLQGGIVITNEHGKPIAVYKMPLKKGKLNLGEIQTITISHNVKLAVIETAFRDGTYNAAKTEAAFELCNVPIIKYHPKVWQKILPKGKGKQRAYDYCLANGWPVPLNKNGAFHDGIADAWGIVAYYLQKINEGKT
jgi:hypothetical protein